MTPERSRAILVGAGETVVGVVLFIGTRQFLGRLRTPATPAVVVVARVLATRMAVQGVVVAGWPQAARAGALVDTAHAASMLPLAVGSRWRRAARASALAAFAAAAGQLSIEHSQPTVRP